MKSNIHIRHQLGFTLIELIMVIVILGVLSAFAIPKYFDIQSTAKEAVLSSIEGSLRSAHNIVYLQSILQNNLDELNGDTQVSEGTIDVHHGHPRTHWSITWQKIIDIDAQGISSSDKSQICNSDSEFCAQYNVKHGTAGYSNDWTIYIIPNGYSVNDNCYARYTLDIYTTTPYLVAFDTAESGC